MKMILLIFIVAATTVVSQLILKKGVLALALSRATPAFLVTAALTSPYVLISLAHQGMNSLLCAVVFSQSNRGYNSSSTNTLLARIRDGHNY